MACSLCAQRKGRRHCPALAQTICGVCCGTKRLTEIRCPSTCAYLIASREHPAAAVRQQQERDVAALLPSIRLLTERQYQLFFLFHTLIARHTPEGFGRLVDDDVAEAAAAAAATLETGANGIVYEHRPAGGLAQHLATELQSMLTEARQQGAVVYDREAAIVLRAIERGAREVGQGGPDAVAYLSLVGRLLQVERGPDDAAAGPPAGSGLILP